MEHSFSGLSFSGHGAAPSTRPDCRAQAAEARRKSNSIAHALDAIAQAERVDLAFLFDATSSMQPHINAVKSQIRHIVARCRCTSPNLTLGIGFVAYRDYCDSERFARQPFTSDVAQFEAALDRVTAWGGGDGGWSGNAAGNKILIHIADAPFHGEESCRLENCFWISWTLVWSTSLGATTAAQM